MLFNSIEFAFFLPIVFFLYWFVVNKNLRAQNFLLIVASFIFYGWWDWRFLFLLIVSTIIDFIAGILIDQSTTQRQRKLLLLISICSNLTILGFFKYFNFFADSFVVAFHLLGFELHPFTLRILLPVGVSFYTFQALSYTIDIYREKLKPTKDPITYFAFISFFPQLVAGPIERASHMLPQYYLPREFDFQKAKDGMRQILWGLFKKVVIADNCEQTVTYAFTRHAEFSGATLAFGVVVFAFQIYCDFSGYSDIAIGTARLFGFDLMRNFNFPYFSKDITEFWRRWHISLSTWFNDYLFQPLMIATREWGKFGVNFSLLITFLLAGLWHGAGWKFIVYGLLHGCALVYEFQTKKFRKKLSKKYAGNIYDIASMLLTFSFVCFAMIFFRAENFYQAFQVMSKIFSLSFFTIPKIDSLLLPALILFLIVTEWIQKDKQHPLQNLETRFPVVVRWGIYYALFLSLFLIPGAQKQFIYFQF